MRHGGDGVSSGVGEDAGRHGGAELHVQDDFMQNGVVRHVRQHVCRDGVRGVTIRHGMVVGGGGGVQQVVRGRDRRDVGYVGLDRTHGVVDGIWN